MVFKAILPQKGGGGGGGGGAPPSYPLWLDPWGNFRQLSRLARELV